MSTDTKLVILLVASGLLILLALWIVMLLVDIKDAIEEPKTTQPKNEYLDFYDPLR